MIRTESPYLHYINSNSDYPPERELKILFIKDNMMPNGYRVITGCYFFDGEHSFYYKTPSVDISGCGLLKNVFAWMDFPQLQLDSSDITGSEFRKWRRNLDITQEEVAESIGCTVSAISRWESGEIDFRQSLYDKVIKFYEERNKDGE